MATSTPHPAPLIISDNDFEVMKDIHAQLHLRKGVFDVFFMLIWRHILRANIPDLEGLCRTVHTGMNPAPPAVVTLTTSFLAEYGPLLWPIKTRSHLSKTSRLAAASFWPHPNGFLALAAPSYRLHSRLSERQAEAFRQQHGVAPDNVASAFNSRLGQLLKIFILAALHYSLIDEGYVTAITADPRVCLHLILVEDKDDDLVAAEHVKPRVEGSGPLADALNKEAGKTWDSAEVLRWSEEVFEETCGRGGLPIVEGGWEVMEVD